MQISVLTYRLQSGVTHAGMFYCFFYILAFLSFIPILGSFIFIAVHCNPFSLILSAFKYKFSIDVSYIIIGLIWGIKHPIDISPFKTILRIALTRFLKTFGILTLIGASLAIVASILATLLYE